MNRVIGGIVWVLDVILDRLSRIVSFISDLPYRRRYGWRLEHPPR